MAATAREDRNSQRLSHFARRLDRRQAADLVDYTIQTRSSRGINRLVYVPLMHFVETWRVMFCYTTFDKQLLKSKVIVTWCFVELNDQNNLICINILSSQQVNDVQLKSDH